jgi:hypothetical protein
VRERIRDSIVDNVEATIATSVTAPLDDSVKERVLERVIASVQEHVWEHVWDSVDDSVWNRVEANFTESTWERMWEHRSDSTSLVHQVRERVFDSVEAYHDAGRIAYYRFYAHALASNDLQALACFNELVSGYWLGEEATILVRWPKRLSCDAEGRLHSATGTRMEHLDGWGFHAWHGVRVPEKVILKLEQLTRADWSEAENVEVRRVMQERMGERFVRELEGTVMDTGPRGTLYEVRLPENDPDKAARYVQVQDASTPRQYFLRVPPTVQTAAEAVSWSFQVSVEEYDPAQET